ncbi:lipocalin family protein [Roseivirga sp. BDSF3-8]|uniref:lipocalin family protein n=1 Tax=Roseivirga sp. BDSF3-8 TaxID=3241598 RepID=UPI0035324D88
MRRYNYMLLLKRPGYFLLVISSLFLLLYLTSCEFEQIGPEGLTRTEMLAGMLGSDKAWELQYFTVDGQRIYPSYCDEDNLTIFAHNGSYTLDHGYESCYPSEPDSEYGQWYFTNNGNDVMIGVNGNRFEYEIQSLSSNRLEIALYSLGNRTVSTFRAAY